MLNHAMTPRPLRLLLGFLAVATLTISTHAQDGPTAARWKQGGVPPLPVNVVGGGEVLLEVAVDRTGQVDTISALRTTPPFTELLVRSVVGWQFEPATESGTRRTDGRAPRIAVDSRVLVAGVFRPPVLVGPSIGAEPKDEASPSGQIPFPLAMSQPRYPPQAANGGVVLAEIELNPDGRVIASKILRSTPPFDAAAREAINELRFSPPRLPSIPASTYVYVVFGFPVPIGIGQPPPPPKP